MLVPPSFQVAYDQHREVIDEVRHYAERRLRTLCADRGWLFDDRVKTGESTLSKLQLGEYESISDVPDFYAATVVVPTQAELTGATQDVVALFDGAIVRPSRTTTPEGFPYDDVHVLATLGRIVRAIQPQVVQDRRFEVQVRTGLQFAWWRATHDSLYKGERPDWRLRRLAGQLRASLEMVDGILGQLKAAAQLVPARADPPSPEWDTVVSWLTRWPELRRPIDTIRYGETALLYTSAANVDVADVTTLLAEAASVPVIDDVEITPAQALLALLAERIGPAVIGELRARGRYLLITPEMELRSQNLAAVAAPDRVRVQ